MHATAIEIEPTSAAERFTLWAAQQLGLDVGDDGAGRFWLDVPTESQADFEGSQRIWFTFDQELYSQSRDEAMELAAPGGRLISWLVNQVRLLGNVAHAAPADQLASVHEISGRLFPAYRLEGGTVRLAGCTLDDRLVLRFTFRLRLEGLEPRDELVDVLLGDDGQPLTEEARSRLGLGQLVPFERPARLNESKLEWLIETGMQLAEERRREAEDLGMAELTPRRHVEERQLADYFSKTRTDVAESLSEDLSPEERAAVAEQLATLDAQFQRRLAGLDERYSVHGRIELVATTLIWCKHASGKLRFSFGPQTTDLAFADWARSLEPPPWVCPHTGRASHHLISTDDGLITAAEEVDRCEQTGRLVLRRELGICAVTGRSVLREFLSECPVSGETLLTDQLVACSECRQQVSPNAIEQRRCTACRTRLEVAKTDPRMALVFGEHPKLEAGRGWSLSETSTVYNLAAAGFFKRLLIVLDKRSLEVLHLATGSRLSSSWTPIPLERFEQEMA